MYINGDVRLLMKCRFMTVLQHLENYANHWKTHKLFHVSTPRHDIYAKKQCNLALKCMQISNHSSIRSVAKNSLRNVSHRTIWTSTVGRSPINVIPLTCGLCINLLLRKHLKQLHGKNSFDSVRSKSHLYECSCHTLETMRKNGRKTVEIEEIGEIKYLRYCSLAFIEN